MELIGCGLMQQIRLKSGQICTEDRPIVILGHHSRQREMRKKNLSTMNAMLTRLTGDQIFTQHHLLMTLECHSRRTDMRQKLNTVYSRLTHLIGDQVCTKHRLLMILEDHFRNACISIVYFNQPKIISQLLGQSRAPSCFFDLSSRAPVVASGITVESKQQIRRKGQHIHSSRSLHVFSGAPKGALSFRCVTTSSKQHTE